jgi:hypothetical protein
MLIIIPHDGGSFLQPTGLEVQYSQDPLRDAPSIPSERHTAIPLPSKLSVRGFLNTLTDA